MLDIRSQALGAEEVDDDLVDVVLHEDLLQLLLLLARELGGQLTKPLDRCYDAVCVDDLPMEDVLLYEEDQFLHELFEVKRLCAGVLESVDVGESNDQLLLLVRNFLSNALIAY